MNNINYDFEQCAATKSMAANSPVEFYDTNPIISASYLYKRNKYTQQWQKIWVVLKQDLLIYYKHSHESRPTKVIKKNNLQAFNVISGDNHQFNIHTGDRTLQLRAITYEDYLQWINGLKRFFNQGDYFDQDFKLELPTTSLDNDKAWNTPWNESVSSRSSQSSEFYFNSRYNLATKSSSLSRANSSIRPNPMSRSSSSSRVVSPSWLSPTSRSCSSSTFSGVNGYSRAFEFGEISNSPSSPVSPASSCPITPSSSSSSSFYNSSASKLDFVGNFVYHENEYIIESGYCKKFFKRSNRWKQFYLVLTNQYLYILNNNQDRVPYKTIPNSDLVDVVELDPISKSEYWCLWVVCESTLFKLCTDDEPDMVKWLSALKTISIINNNI